PWPRWPGRWDAAAVRALAGVGSAVQASTLAAQAGDLAFRSILGARFGAAAIGAYDLATRAAMAPRHAASAVPVALVPQAQALAGPRRRAACRGRQRGGVRRGVGGRPRRGTRAAAPGPGDGGGRHGGAAGGARPGRLPRRPAGVDATRGCRVDRGPPMIAALLLLATAAAAPIVSRRVTGDVATPAAIVIATWAGTLGLFALDLIDYPPLPPHVAWLIAGTVAALVAGAIAGQRLADGDSRR